MLPTASSAMQIKHVRVVISASSTLNLHNSEKHFQLNSTAVPSERKNRRYDPDYCCSLFATSHSGKYETKSHYEDFEASNYTPININQIKLFDDTIEIFEMLLTIL